MLRSYLLLAALLGFASPTLAAAPSVSPDPKTLIVSDEELSRARDLVQKLGSEAYAEREEAELSLAKMGRLARVALFDGLHNDPNAEVRTRCQELLPKATHLEMKARLAVFLADTEGKFEHDLAGWNQFRSVVRKDWMLFGYLIWSDHSLDVPARAMFAELISTQANRHILLTIGGPPADLSGLAATRRQELYSQKYPRVMFVGGAMSRPEQREPTVADIATLLLLESRAGVNFVPPRTAPISTLLSASAFARAAVAGDERGKVCQAIATAWFDSRHDALDMYYAMNVANNLGLPEQGIQLAIRLLQSKGAIPAYRGMAATALVRTGNKSHIPMLEKSMTDNAVVFTARKAIAGKPGEVETHDIQLRDISLIVSLLLTQQKPEDYGFVDQYKAQGVPTTNYNYTRFYVPEKERDAAMAKWKEWRSKNP
ncbi:MAG: hypothetical protein K8U57_23265 [Planctomycetes bacterium]|nr:hypothetical protein [Planctomycetota bacterium]